MTENARRVTRLLGADGALLLEYGVGLVLTHPSHVLEDCQKLFGQERK